MMPAQHDLLARLTEALFALLLILASLQGPKGPPTAPSAQLEFPFMATPQRPSKEVTQADVMEEMARAEVIRWGVGE